MSLTKCPSCGMHTSGILANDYAYNQQFDTSLKPLRPNTKRTDKLCEFCGWKINHQKVTE